MTKLTKILTTRTFHNANGGEEVQTTVTVLYDSADQSIEVLSISAESVRFAFSNDTFTYSPMSAEVDLTASLRYFPSMLQDIMDMDWESEYQSQRRAA
jgi:hypothetical protein